MPEFSFIAQTVEKRIYVKPDKPGRIFIKCFFEQRQSFLFFSESGINKSPNIRRNILFPFKNIQVFFLGSDDFLAEVKRAAARDLNAALEAGWSGFAIAERIPLAEIARAHELAEHPRNPGRVVVTL